MIIFIHKNGSKSGVFRTGEPTKGAPLFAPEHHPVLPLSGAGLLTSIRVVITLQIPTMRTPVVELVASVKNLRVTEAVRPPRDVIYA